MRILNYVKWPLIGPLVPSRLASRPHVARTRGPSRDPLFPDFSPLHPLLACSYPLVTTILILFLQSMLYLPAEELHEYYQGQGPHHEDSGFL